MERRASPPVHNEFATTKSAEQNAPQRRVKRSGFRNPVPPQNGKTSRSGGPGLGRSLLTSSRQTN